MAGKNLPMPLKAKPYLHQQQAFDFACEKFGLLHEFTNRSRGVALLMEMGCGKNDCISGNIRYLVSVWFGKQGPRCGSAFHRRCVERRI